MKQYSPMHRWYIEKRPDRANYQYLPATNIYNLWLRSSQADASDS